MTDKLSKIAKAFPRALGRREVTDPWELGFRLTVMRSDNKAYSEWLEAHVDQDKMGEAYIKARLSVELEQKDWRKPLSEAEIEERTLERFELDGVHGSSIEEQAEGIRLHLVARDDDGPLAYLDGERLGDDDLLRLTQIQYDDDGSVSRWLPSDRPLGGRAFELAFLIWIFREASDLAAFEQERQERDLGNSDGGPAGGTRSMSSDPSRSSGGPANSSKTEPSSAPAVGA